MSKRNWRGHGDHIGGSTGDPGNLSLFKRESIERLASNGRQKQVNVKEYERGYYSNGNKCAPNIGVEIKGKRLCIKCLKTEVFYSGAKAFQYRARLEDKICEECKTKGAPNGT